LARFNYFLPAFGREAQARDIGFVDIESHKEGGIVGKRDDGRVELWGDILARMPKFAQDHAIKRRSDIGFFKVGAGFLTFVKSGCRFSFWPWELS
jgi:hypothetical protein